MEIVTSPSKETPVLLEQVNKKMFGGLVFFGWFVCLGVCFYFNLQSLRELGVPDLAHFIVVGTMRL